MADSALLQLDPAQREHLRMLGYELYVLRAPGFSRAGQTHAPASPDAARLALLGVDVAGADPLLAALLRALALDPSHVIAGARPGLPTLAFGTAPGLEADAVIAPAWADLRRPGAKRALWPMLRRLRRRLQQTLPDA
jgi:DNA polymerase III psi subunit